MRLFHRKKSYLVLKKIIMSLSISRSLFFSPSIYPPVCLSFSFVLLSISRTNRMRLNGPRRIGSLYLVLRRILDADFFLSWTEARRVQCDSNNSRQNLDLSQWIIFIFGSYKYNDNDDDNNDHHTTKTRTTMKSDYSDNGKDTN